MVAQSDGMITPIQESATSIQTIPFCDDIVSVTMLQEEQLVMFADVTSYGKGYLNQQQEPQHTMAGVSKIVNGEKDHEKMPYLFFENRERFWNQRC